MEMRGIVIIPVDEHLETSEHGNCRHLFFLEGQDEMSIPHSPAGFKWEMRFWNCARWRKG